MKPKVKGIPNPPLAHIATGGEIGIKVPNKISIAGIQIEAGATAVFDRRCHLENRNIILFHHCGEYRIGMLEKTWSDLWNIFCPDYGLVSIRPHELRHLGVYKRSDEFFTFDDFGV